MKFKAYVDSLVEFLKENPESAEYEAYWSTDPEGNGYYRVNYGPGLRMCPDVGNYYADYMFSEEDTEYFQEEDEDYQYKPNVVVIN